MTAHLTFAGGAGEVTGANFLLDGGVMRILVDCGLHQRENACSPENYVPFIYDVRTIDVLIITHAHADHIGRVPRLIHEGFKGKIYSTHATRDLSSLMFDDALSLMNRPENNCEPLYTADDVEQALSLWQGKDYHESFACGDATVEFLDAGHILGSAMARMTRQGKTILFTGDLGNTPEPLLRETESPEGSHYVVMESVYGDRLHEEKGDRRMHLSEAIEETRHKKGVLLIPSFSLERTQVLLSEINDIVESGEMAPIPVFLDAPLSIKATELYKKYRALLNDRIQEKWNTGDDPFAFEGLKITPRAGDSESIHTSPNPKVIIAGAGMSHGGRIREHEREYLGDASTTVLFVGYQSAGSLGRKLQEGIRKVEIDGAVLPVRATMRTLTGYSGHADRDQLLSFLEKTVNTVQQVFVAMGEPKSELFFAQRAHDFLGVNATVPTQGQTVEIEW